MWAVFPAPHSPDAFALKVLCVPSLTCGCVAFFFLCPLRLRLVCVCMLLPQSIVVSLSSADSGANVLVDVGTAEDALCASMFRFTSTVEWAWGVVQSAPVGPADSGAQASLQSGPAALGYALPSGVGVHALADACLEDLSGRRVVCLRDGGGSVLLVANHPVPPVLASYYFEVRGSVGGCCLHASRLLLQRAHGFALLDTL